MMRAARLALVLATLVFVLSACGRVPTASAVSSPSPPAVASESALPAPSPLTVPGPQLHGGEVGLPYAMVAYTASGGTPPYFWTTSGGALPGGMTLSQNGQIAGTPTTAGNFSFAVAVTDTAGISVNLAGSMDIASKLSITYLRDPASTDSETGLPIVNMCMGARADHPCPAADDPSAPFGAAAGGVRPYTYALVSGTLPAGAALNGLGLTWRLPLSPCPTPLYAGSCPAPDLKLYPVSVQVTDAFGAKSTISVELWLYRT